MALNPQTRVRGKLRLEIFQEAFAICPFCGLEKIGSLQVHHVDGNSLNHERKNLIASCASCHDQITKGLKSEADVLTAKRMLEAGFHPFRKRAATGGNNVQVVETVNSGIIANKVTFTKSKPGPIILPGSIGSVPQKYNYVEYLLKRLTTYRQAGASYGQVRKGKLHTGVTRKILENEFGGLPKDLPLEQYDGLVATLKLKIDKTALGTNNLSKGVRNFHPFEEHGLPKKRRRT